MLFSSCLRSSPSMAGQSATLSSFLSVSRHRQFCAASESSSISIFVEILTDLRRGGRQRVLMVGLRENCLNLLMHVPEFRALASPGTPADGSDGAEASKLQQQQRGAGESALFSNVQAAVRALTAPPQLSDAAVISSDADLLSQPSIAY